MCLSLFLSVCLCLCLSVSVSLSLCFSFTGLKWEMVGIGITLWGVGGGGGGVGTKTKQQAGQQGWLTLSLHSSLSPLCIQPAGWLPCVRWPISHRARRKPARPATNGGQATGSAFRSRVSRAGEKSLALCADAFFFFLFFFFPSLLFFIFVSVLLYVYRNH